MRARPKSSKGTGRGVRLGGRREAKGQMMPS